MYNVKAAAQAAFLLLSMAALAGCSEPTKAKSSQQADAGDQAPRYAQADRAADLDLQAANVPNCACIGSKRRGTSQASSVRHATVKRSAPRRVASHARGYSSSAYSSSTTNYAESEYYSSSYVSHSSVTAASSSYAYGAAGHAYAKSGYGARAGVWVDGYGKQYDAGAYAPGWIDGYGKHYAAAPSWGANYPEYRDGGPGAAYLDVVTDDRARANPWQGYNFRAGVSSGY